MDANETERKELLFKEEAFRVVGCAMEVHNELGRGFREKTYERALVQELTLQGIPCEAQKEFGVRYKGMEIDTFVPDLIVFGEIVVETKTNPQITDSELGQVLNFLKVTGLTLGVILNFKNPRLEWQRVVRQVSPLKKGPRSRQLQDPEAEIHSR